MLLVGFSYYLFGTNVLKLGINEKTAKIIYDIHNELPISSLLTNRYGPIQLLEKKFNVKKDE